LKECRHAASDSLERWPLHYWRGLVDGLFFDENGKPQTTVWALTLIPDILRPTADQAGELHRLLGSVWTEPLGPGDSDD
jgi:hypothetical protein